MYMLSVSAHLLFYINSMSDTNWSIKKCLFKRMKGDPSFFYMNFLVIKLIYLCNNLKQFENKGDIDFF